MFFEVGHPFKYEWHCSIDKGARRGDERNVS